MKRNFSKECDFVVMLIVFLISASYIAHFFVLQTNPKNPQRVYEIFNTFELSALAGALVWKAYRLNSCIYTKVVTLMYVAMLMNSFIYLINPYNYQVFLSLYMVISVVCCSLILFYFLISNIK